MKHFKSEWNPITGAKEDYYYDDVTHSIGLKSAFNVTDVIEKNKRQQNASIDSRFGNEMLHHVAEIPLSIITKWKADYGVDVFSNDPDQQKKVMRLLNDPDWRYLKSTVKRV